MPSANTFREAALAALRNAQLLCDEAKLLAQADHVARAAALAVIGVEECAKTFGYTIAAIFPDESERGLERLNRHDVKQLILAEFEGIEIVTSEGAQILSQQTGFAVSWEERLTDIFSDFAAIFVSDKFIPSVRQAQKHHEMMKPKKEEALSTSYIKNAALYVGISPAGEILVPERVSKYVHREIGGLEWNLDKLCVLKEILPEDKRWDRFCARVRAQM
jgi:AbiV family abortive infection protein